MSGASERANGRASGPVLQSVFLAVIDHRGGGRGGFSPSNLFFVVDHFTNGFALYKKLQCKCTRLIKWFTMTVDPSVGPSLCFQFV